MQKVLDIVKNNRRVFRIISLILTIITIILGMLWVRNPAGNYEPFISVLCILIGLIGTPTLIDLSSKGGISSNPPVSWPAAINIGIKNFAKLHTNVWKIEKSKINVTSEQARIRLFVSKVRSNGFQSTIYTLVINKAGEIIEITQNRSFP